MGDMITVFKCLQEKFDKRGLFRAREKIQDKFRAGLSFVALFEQ